MNEVSHHSPSEVQKSESRDIFNIESYDIDIDLIGKARDIWDGRRTILLFIVACIALAYFHSEFGPTEYISTTSLIQESEGASVRDFGSSFLQSLTGMNISTGSSANMSAVATGRAPLPVSLYPVIVRSTEFQKELIYTELEFSSLDSTLTLFDYYHDHLDASLRDQVYSIAKNMTIYLPFTVLDWTKSLLRKGKNILVSLWRGESNTQNEQAEEVEVIQDDRLQSVTPEESSVINWLIIRIALASEGGIMQISTTLPDPKAAALVNVELVEHIQDYITEYRIKKARQNLEETLERFEIAKQRYEEAQYRLAEFRDENINLTTEAAQIEESRLSNEASLRFNIYNSIAQEVEQARMILQQQIPVFNTLEKPNVPSSPSTGTSPLLMVVAGLLGLFIGVGWVLIRSFTFNK